MRWTTAGATVALTVLIVGGSAARAQAQLGALVSPGRLNKAHASLEGITSCLSCHTAGQGVSPAKCLTCHRPIADRIAQKRGVHRAVTTDCVKCHVEHAGVDAELRPFDQRAFNHARETGFALDGLHAPVATTCTACHKTRSFLGVVATCASCHTDAHKGTLGTQCATCHTTSVRFADSRKGFDHSRTRFALTGAHAGVSCAACHKNNTYRGVAFTTCASCHTDAHQGSFGSACVSCHTTTGWRTARIDHSRTTFPLKGLHATVDCARCHVQPATQVRVQAATCAACHADPHKGGFKQDCAACHTEAGFKKGAFDHSTTRFPLVEKHAGLACAACHKGTGDVGPPAARGVVPLSGRGRPASRALPPPVTPVRNADFRGLRTACVSCHEDVHKGELGASCETCHSARSFAVGTFVHARQQRPFFAGQHAALRCVQCHAPQAPRMVHVGLATTSDTCASCHADVHAGQLGAACDSCHTVDRAKFALPTFAHEKTTFPLTGKHAPLSCAACHKVEAAAFPAGAATARRFKGIGVACASCHQDRHAGQLRQGCQTCHTTDTFVVTRYKHLRARALGDFFTGRHVSPACGACHKPLKGAPAAALVSYRTPTTCVSCHTDVHRGGLGPRCEACHKP